LREPQKGCLRLETPRARYSTAFRAQSVEDDLLQRRSVSHRWTSRPSEEGQDRRLATKVIPKRPSSPRVNHSRIVEAVDATSRGGCKHPRAFRLSPSRQDSVAGGPRLTLRKRQAACR